MLSIKRDLYLSKRLQARAPGGEWEVFLELLDGQVLILHISCLVYPTLGMCQGRKK